jgi:hypothetical protein
LPSIATASSSRVARDACATGRVFRVDAVRALDVALIFGRRAAAYDRRSDEESAQGSRDTLHDLKVHVYSPPPSTALPASDIGHSCVKEHAVVSGSSSPLSPPMHDESPFAQLEMPTRVESR